MRGIDIIPRVVYAGIIAIGRQLINGDVKLTDIPSPTPLPEQSCSGHLAVLHHLIKRVGRHADVSGGGFATDEPWCK